MKHIRESQLTGLVWMQRQAKVRAFELRAGEEVVGTLSWRSRFGSLADALAADGHWTFKRTGFFDPRVSVRVHGHDTDLAMYTPRWTGDGVMESASGQRVFWKGSGFWRSRWSFSSASGERLVDFEPCDSLLKKSASVKVTPTGLATADLSLLVLLGWYLMLLQSDDDAGVAASVTCVVAAA